MKVADYIMNEFPNVAQQEPKIIFHHHLRWMSTSVKIASYFCEFILKVISKCSTTLKERVLSRHKLLERVFENLKVGSIYSWEIKNVYLLWVYVILH